MAHKIRTMIHVMCIFPGITEIQSEPLVNNDSKITKGFTLEMQINSQRKNGPIKVIQ